MNVRAFVTEATRAGLAVALACGCVPDNVAFGPARSAADAAAPTLLTKVEVADAPWRTEALEQHPASIDGAPAIIFRGARLLVGDGTEIPVGHVVVVRGRITAVGEGPGEAPAGARVLDVSGKTITPGLIDTHSHMGVFPMPAAAAHRDGNEMTASTTAAVRAIDAVWAHDPAFQRALAGGTTTVQVLPGSANLIGGRATTLKLVPSNTAEGMHFKGAPDGLKMACGENPKRVYGNRTQAPMTRMGNLAGQRTAFLAAKKLIAQWEQFRVTELQRQTQHRDATQRFAAETKDRETKRAACAQKTARARDCRQWEASFAKESPKPPEPLEPRLPPDRDLGAETLAAAIEGRVLVHVHCYRADDMTRMMALADEMAFSIRSFHHALDAYKIRDVLAKRRISVSTWADWWGFKLEAWDGIPENLALIHASGGIPILHTDSDEGVRRMNQEASKAMWSGRHAGLGITDAEAIRWVTMNPAWALGIDAWVGSLAVGKDADLVVWDRDPFSVYAHAERVFVDGLERHQRGAPGRPRSDFEATP
ncbi:MAG: amidohydrolase [Myxococcales bacterium]|nr:amidohydrolase [Myxococcales bacterium]